MKLEENQKKVLFYVCIGVVIAIQVILLLQCKQYYDSAIAYKTLYETCQNSTTLDWSGFLQ